MFSHAGGQVNPKRVKKFDYEVRRTRHSSQTKEAKPQKNTD